MLPFRSGRSPSLGVALALVLTFAVGPSVFSKGKKREETPRAAAKPTATPAGGLTNIPLPVGHEAKGLVLPNFDLDGHLTGKLEAGTAKRIDEENVEFAGLKLTTFTDENKTDLEIDMSTSILNLKTRVISSKQRTTVRRVDFKIEGDSMQFDTVTRRGKLVGHVKMVLTGKTRLVGRDEKQNE